MSELSKMESPAVLHGIRVVDADTHISERADLWTSRAPAKYKDRVPQRRTINGKFSWYIDGATDLGTGSAASAIRKDGLKSKAFEFLDWRVEDVLPAAYDVKERLKIMDRDGIPGVRIQGDGTQVKVESARRLPPPDICLLLVRESLHR
jgi:uncharacterized protein